MFFAPEGNLIVINPFFAQLYVVNSHIHWDPRFADVKLVQTQILLEEMERITNRDPVIFCADLNSTTESAVYEVPVKLEELYSFALSQFSCHPVVVREELSPTKSSRSAVWLQIW